MKKKFIVLAVILCLLAGLGLTFAFLGGGEVAMGVWWWNDELESQVYLDFAEDNDINEVYFCTSKFNDQTSEFISQANARGMDVYWLAGEYQWLDDSTSLFEQIDNYLAYQQNHPTAKFSGIHLDIEPHQSPDWEERPKELYYNLIDLANTLKKTYPAIKFDYDITFWMDEQISYNGQTKPAYQFMIDIANRVFLMSYRDSAEGILSVSEEEIEYAKAQNKPLFLGVETYSTEGDKVSFMEEGKQFMQQEITKVKQQIPKNFGLSIHHIRTWFELKD